MIAECQVGNEDRHGETDAGQQAQTYEVAPGQVRRQAAQACCDGKVTQQHDANRFAKDQSGNDAQAVGLAKALLPLRIKHNACVGQCKEGQDEKCHRLVQQVFQAVRGIPPVLLLARTELQRQATRRRWLRAHPT